MTASQAGNADYNAAPNVARTFSVLNSRFGSADGDGLQPSNGGEAEFHVDADPPGHGHGPAGKLVYDGPRPPKPGKGRQAPPALHFESREITSFGIADDGNSAWFAGVGKDGRSFLVYIEDNNRRHHSRRDPDVFQLWIDGVAQTGDGSLDSGSVDIELPFFHFWWD